MEFKQVLQTKNISQWVNKKYYIVLHHTWTAQWTLKWNLNTLLGLTEREVSAHYLIDWNWDIYKLANDEQITWHCWDSSYQWLKGLNNYSIWIEVIWPNFTNEQKIACKELLQYLLDKNNITYKNIIRHKDIAPWRKTDIDDSFWNKEFKTFEDYKLQFKKSNMSKYTQIMQDKLKALNLKPIFNSHEWNEQEVKELIEIALAEFYNRYIKK